MTIDLDRCRRGMAQLRVEGIPRASLIEETIAAIQRDPTTAMRERYVGIKNYAGFGDQREDHTYGMGPAHGSIVFSIGLTDHVRGATIGSEQRAPDADAIYYLEAYRDFKSINWPPLHEANRVDQMTLSAAIREFDLLNARRNTLADAFAAVSVDAHVVTE